MSDGCSLDRRFLFLEPPQGELRRILLLGTSVNRPCCASSIGLGPEARDASDVRRTVADSERHSPERTLGEAVEERGHD
jgi:hypothetical protein